MQRIAWAAAWVAGAMCTGCVKPEPQAELDELASVKRQAASVNDQLEGVQARLLVAKGTVHADEDLQARHHQVSEIACQNLSDHWAGINRFLDNQRDKASKKHRARVASAEPEQRD